MICVVFLLALAPYYLVGSVRSEEVQNSTSEGKVIYLLSLLPYYNPIPYANPSWNEGDNIQPALELAKDQINNSSSLLQNHTLQIIHSESGCDSFLASTTIVSFFMKAFTPAGDSQLAGIIGPGCSSSTTALAALTNRPDLALVMVHGSGSPTLANRTLYQYSLGTLGSTESFVKGFLHVLSVARWQRVAILFDNSRLYYASTKRLLLMEMANLNLKPEFLSPISTTFMPLAAIQEQRLRVIFVLCPLELSRRIICLSYNSGMIYSTYQWVFSSHILEDLVQPIDFAFDRNTYNCSKENMATALEMASLMNYNFRPSENSTLVSNISYTDYERYYEDYRDRYNAQAPRVRNSTYTYWAAYLYDAVWAWALVLDNLTRSNSGFDFSAGGYGNLNQSDKIVQQFYRTEFSGISGKIDFSNDSGYTERAVDLVQIRNATAVEIAHVSNNSITSEETDLLFIPDSYPNSLKENNIVGAFFTGIVIILFVLSLILHILTVVYRNRPSIRASSPKLLHISYIGFYIILAGMFIWNFKTAASIDSKFRRYFCQLLWGWCLPIGFIVMFAPVAMRTWRVYRIFKHYLNPGPLISDPILISGILLLLTPILMIAIIWSAADPFYTVEQFRFSRDVTGIVVKVKTECTCAYYFVWLGTILGYTTAILLLVTVFALLTRNISNRSFATSALRVLVYVMAILFSLGFPIFYLLDFVTFDPIYSFFALSIQLFLMSSAFIVCVFIPPLLPVFRVYRQKVRKISLASISTTYSSY